MLINIENPIYLPLAIYDMFFNGSKISYRNTPVKLHIVTMKAGGTIKKAKVGDFIYLEQNPNKDSEHGRLAKEGNNIMWVIYEPSTHGYNLPFKPNTYIAKVMNGVTHRLV